MTKADPIIAVKNVKASSLWYQSVLGCKSMHGGNEFDVLVSEKEEVLICLHQWGEHQHPTMTDLEIPSGNGLILYFRTKNLDEVRQSAERLDCAIDRDVSVNPNSGRKEFSLRDPDGYYLIISEYHQYEG